MEGNLVDIYHASKLLGIRPKTIRNWLSSGKFPKGVSIKVGRRRLFLRDRLMKLVEGLKEVGA